MSETIESPLHGGPDALGVPRHDFSTNANACGPCPAALAALQRADASRYPDPGYGALRESLAERHGVEPGRIVIAASASEFIHRISAFVARRAPASSVWLPDHCYGDYAQAALVWGLQRAPFQQADLIWLCDPSSPLGQPVDDLAGRIAALAPQQQGVLDCAYEPLRLQGSRDPGANLDRIWQLWTPNKALGLTGVRAAYAIAPLGAEEAVTGLQRLACSWPVGAHGVAMLQAWTSDAVADWLARSLQTLRTWKARQTAICDDLGWRIEPSVANYFVAHPAGIDLEGDLMRLRRAGIKLRDAASFGLPGWVRLGVLAPGSQDALARAWKSIKEDR